MNLGLPNTVLGHVIAVLPKLGIHGQIHLANTLHSLLEQQAEHYGTLLKVLKGSGVRPPVQEIEARDSHTPLTIRYFLNNPQVEEFIFISVKNPENS